MRLCCEMAVKGKRYSLAPRHLMAGSSGAEWVGQVGRDWLRVNGDLGASWESCKIASEKGGPTCTRQLVGRLDRAARRAARSGLPAK